MVGYRTKFIAGTWKVSRVDDVRVLLRKHDDFPVSDRPLDGHCIVLMLLMMPSVK